MNIDAMTANTLFFLRIRDLLLILGPHGNVMDDEKRKIICGGRGTYQPLPPCVLVFLIITNLVDKSI